MDGTKYSVGLLRDNYKRRHIAPGGHLYPDQLRARLHDHMIAQPWCSEPIWHPHEGILADLGWPMRLHL